MVSQQSTFNNIPINNLRQSFYDVLDDKTHDRYINMLFSFFLLIQEPLSKVQFKYRKYKMTFTSIDNKSLCLFGGSYFYLIFKEAEKLGLLEMMDENIIKDFLRTKTIDIDAQNGILIKPSIETLKKEKHKEILDNFSEQYHNFFTEQIIEIMKSNKYLEQEVIELGEIMNLKGHDFKGNEEPINPFIGPNGDFSVSLQVNDDEIRPQLNTCIGEVKFCDHIFEVLSRIDKNWEMEDQQLIKLNGAKFYSQNIMTLCIENIDRMYRAVLDNLGKPPYKKTEIQRLFKKEFEDSPLKKTKYLQGFYRVRMIYTILNNILEHPDPKYDNLLSIFRLNSTDLFSIRSPFRTVFAANMCSKKTYGERISYLNKLYQAKRDLTHEEIRNIIKLMLDFWSEVHQNLVKNYGIPKVSGLTYRAPPEYSSENNSNAGSKSNSQSRSKSNSMSKSKSRSRSRQSTSIKKSKKKSTAKSTNNSELSNVDLTQPDWNTKITDKQLIKLQKDILGKVMPVTKVTRNLIIKKIKKTIN
jgi:hypothetical protein